MNPLTKRLRRLTSLSEDDLDLLEAACHVTRDIRAHADIAPPGDRPVSLHVLLEGWAARYTVLKKGARQFSALLIPGDLCDLNGLMLDPVHTGVCALTQCTVAMIPHAHLRELMDRRPAIRDAVWWLGGVEHAIAAEWCASLGGRSAEERMAHLLCELSVRLATVGLNTQNGYPLPLSQIELGDALGLSPVHVNRTLQALRSQGWITFRDHHVTIHDQAALESLAGFRPGYLHSEG